MWQLGHTLVCIFSLVVCVSVHQSMNVHLLKHEIICDQHQSKSSFFLSVAYRPLIIHSCLLAPRSKFGNSIFSMQATHTFQWCLGNKRIHRSILWKLAHNCTKNGIHLMWRDVTWERPCDPRGKIRMTASWTTKVLKLRCYAKGIFSHSHAKRTRILTHLTNKGNDKNVFKIYIYLID